MKKILGFLLKGVLPPFFVGWSMYFTGKSIYEFIYYRRMLSRLEKELLYIKAKTAVREARVAFLQTRRGRKIFLDKVHKQINKD